MSADNLTACPKCGLAKPHRFDDHEWGLPATFVGSTPTPAGAEDLERLVEDVERGESARVRSEAKSTLSAAIRALTERAEQLDGAREANALLGADVQKAYGQRDAAYLAIANLHAQLSTLTASHAAAMEQERERALRWAWEHPADRYEVSGGLIPHTAAQDAFREAYVARGLAALRGKGEGE